MTRLSDQITLALVEHGPLPCIHVARAVKARKVDVLHALRNDGRFEHVGNGRASRWMLAQDQRGTHREHIQGDETVRPDLDVTLASAETLAALVERVGSLEALVVALSRRLAALEPPSSKITDVSVLDGQLTVDDALAAMNGQVQG